MWIVLLVKLVGAFHWIMVRSNFRSVKLYGSICRRFIVTCRKYFHCAPELRAVKSVSECLNRIDPPFALINMNNYIYFNVHLRYFWGPHDVFIEFHLSFQKTLLPCWENLQFLFNPPCGICLPTSAFIAFLNPFSAW